MLLGACFRRRSSIPHSEDLVCGTRVEEETGSRDRVNPRARKKSVRMGSACYYRQTTAPGSWQAYYCDEVEQRYVQQSEIHTAHQISMTRKDSDTHALGALVLICRQVREVLLVVPGIVFVSFLIRHFIVDTVSYTQDHFLQA